VAGGKNFLAYFFFLLARKIFRLAYFFFPPAYFFFRLAYFLFSPAKKFISPARGMIFPGGSFFPIPISLRRCGLVLECGDLSPLSSSRLVGVKIRGRLWSANPTGVLRAEPQEGEHPSAVYICAPG